MINLLIGLSNFGGAALMLHVMRKWPKDSHAFWQFLFVLNMGFGILNIVAWLR
jgi:hypothetical protein